MATITPPPTKHVPEWTMADRMRKARTDAGYTAQEIADRIGISRKSVTNYENGDTKPLRAILNAWAEVTGTYVEWLEKGRAPFQEVGVNTSSRAATSEYVDEWVDTAGIGAVWSDTDDLALALYAAVHSLEFDRNRSG